MKTLFRRLLTALMTILLTAGLIGTGTGQPVFADTVWPEAPAIISETGILMDADTGAILFEKDMDRVLYPASTTKLMTCLLALENGNLEDQVTMTGTGVYYAQLGSSNLQTKVGEVFTLEQLLYGTMLKSANDMATQVGEYIGGTLEHFVDMMNARAKEIGCRNTHFTNACGMPDAEMVTTAHDLALISQEVLKNETFRKITGTHAYTIPPTNMTAAERKFTNHNPLLVNPDYAYPGIIGGKTGYTDSALNTLVTFVNQNGRTLIAATLMASDATYAASDHRALYDYGFPGFENVAAIPAEYVGEGGFITIPAGGDPKLVTAWDSEIDKTHIRRTYVYGEREVGYAVLTTEMARAYDEAVAEEEKRKEEERLKAEKEAESAAKAEPAAAPAGKDETVEEKEEDDAYLGKLGHMIRNWRQYMTPLNIAIAILGLLVFIFLIIMIRAAVINSRRRRRRRRRRRH